MININGVSKYYEKFKAVDSLTCTVEKGSIYGLVGSNGSGKSTLLRMLAGVFKADEGKIIIDGEEVYDNPESKKRFVYVSDELYFMHGASIWDMAKLYAASYRKFSFKRVQKLSHAFGLDIKAPVSNFSKGMKRQAAVVLALSCMTDYIFLDETFDGLDPVMRRLVKRILYNDVYDRQSTAIITSHSLRELEDTCDKLALLHKGRLIFEKDITDIQTMLFKIQVAFDFEYDESCFPDLDIKAFTKSGKVANMIIGGDRESAEASIRGMSPILMEMLPLTLDEVFTYEMEARGYAFEDLFRKEGENNEQDL